MIELGRLCVKIAGRDAGKEALIVEVIDKNFVLIDGNTRRRKTNVDHLELLPKKAELKKGASHEEVEKALKSLGESVEKKAAARTKKVLKTEEKKKAQPKKTVKKKEAKN